MDALDHVRVQPQLARDDDRPRRAAVTPRRVPRCRRRFTCSPGVLEWDALDWRRQAGGAADGGTPLAASRAGQLRAGARDIAASPGETVESWLVRNGQTARMREMLWHPLALAALNQPPDVAAAPPFARVLAEMFGSRSASGGARAADQAAGFDVRRARARVSSKRRGGTVRTGVAARVLVDGGAVEAVDAAGERWTAGVVVSAVPWFASVRLVRAATPPELVRRLLRGAGAMASSPILTVNLWFDRPSSLEVGIDDPFVGLARPRDAVGVRQARGLRRQRVAPLAGVERRVAARQSDQRPAHRSGAPGAARGDARHQAGASAARDGHPRAKGDVFARARAARRPETRTPVRGLFLAGDWIETGLPATIESAVRSGTGQRTLASGHLVI